MHNVEILDHPLAKVATTIIRNKNTRVAEFRAGIKLIAQILGMKATTTLKTKEVQVSTPLEECTGYALEHTIVLMPILRAGLGMVEPILELIPDAKVGHIGLCRNEHSFEPETYYFKAPKLDGVKIFVLDPMLATGNSAADAIAKIKLAGGKDITMLAIIGSKEGVKNLAEKHPDVHIVVGTLDEKLNDKAYIVPGLGDAGDRYFGTVNE